MREIKDPQKKSNIISKEEVKEVLSCIIRADGSKLMGGELPKPSERIAAAKMLYPILDVQESGKTLQAVEDLIKGRK